jgi:hypothetical protein
MSSASRCGGIPLQIVLLGEIQQTQEGEKPNPVLQ